MGNNSYQFSNHYQTWLLTQKQDQQQLNTLILNSYYFSDTSRYFKESDISSLIKIVPI